MNKFKAIYKNSIVTVYKINWKYYLLNSKGEVKEIKKEELKIIG